MYVWMYIYLANQPACLSICLPGHLLLLLLSLLPLKSLVLVTVSIKVSEWPQSAVHRRMASGNMFGEVDDWDDGKVFGGLDEEGEPEDGSVAAGSAPTGKGRTKAKAKPGAKAKISKEKNQGLLRVPMFCSEGPQLEVLPWPQSRIGGDEVSSAALKKHGGLQFGDE